MVALLYTGAILRNSHASSVCFLHERAMMATKLQECSRSLGPAGRSLA